jgi:hypothetical protein
LQNAALAQGLGGIAVRPVTNAYFFWLQTGGISCCLNGGNTALGSVLVPSATEGALKTMAAYDSIIAGQQVAFAGVDTKYCPVFLTLD